MGYNRNFVFEIGTVFKDEKRDIVITNRLKENSNKGYEYHCNICGFDGKANESEFLNGRKQGCSCCHGKTIVLGINTIWDKARWMCDLGVSEEDAKKYTPNSNTKIYPICPYCGFKKEKGITPNTIYTMKSIGCNKCGDGISYPEKVVSNLFNFIKNDFITQLTKTKFEWCDKYKYDFYFNLNNEDYIVETHGKQHYEDSSWGKASEIQENDRVKKELAVQNGIKEENYIVLDCRYSEINWIKKSILHSKLNKIFELNNIDWIKIDKNSLKSKVFEVCKYKKENPNMSTTDLGIIFKCEGHTILSYLKKGSKIGLYEYDKEQENYLRKVKAKTRAIETNSKGILVFKNNVMVGSFDNISELSRNSVDLFGTNFDVSNMISVCKGKRKNHKGYVFKYK